MVWVRMGVASWTIRGRGEWCDGGDAENGAVKVLVKCWWRLDTALVIGSAGSSRLVSLETHSRWICQLELDGRRRRRRVACGLSAMAALPLVSVDGFCNCWSHNATGGLGPADGVQWVPPL